MMEGKWEIVMCANIYKKSSSTAGTKKCQTCLVEVSMGAWHFCTEPSKTNLPI